MKTTELLNKQLWRYVAQVSAVIFCILLLMFEINTRIDASQVITSRGHTKMAKLALAGKVVATPKNYNERVFQVSVVEEMSQIPETVVVGSSRGMFLGEELTGIDNLYNNCVSGACMEDYYAIFGLYDQKFAALPKRVIMEISPWVFYSDNPEARWAENYTYFSSAKKFYEKVNGHKLDSNIKKENPYFSLPYFQYNISIWKEKGKVAFEGEPARESTNVSEAADYPDGSIRYEAGLENRSESRLAGVKAVNGGVTYEEVIHMIEMDDADIQSYEYMLNYLEENGTDVIIYLQPFSLTQCKYIYEKNTNPVFLKVEEYLRELAKERGLTIVGSFDSRGYDITDEDFIDFMHLDKAGTTIVWNTDYYGK